MRTAIAILIMFSLTFQGMVKVAIIGWYEMNKDYIAKNLCENRDKPAMKCCGKCYLKKQLKKTEDNTSTDSKQAPRKQNKVEIAEFIVPQIAQSLCVAEQDIHTCNAVMQNMHSREHFSSVFHPPSAQVTMPVEC